MSSFGFVAGQVQK